MLSRRSALPPPALFLLLALAAGPALAQTEAPGTPPVVSAAPSAADQTSVPDLIPLKKALAPLASRGLLEVQSSFEQSGSRGGAMFTFRENAHILARRGGLFRVELSPVGADGTPKPKMLVVSDGKQVWTYRPGQRAYSVVTRKAFVDADDDVTALGLVVGSFFLGDGHDMADGFRDITKANSGDVLEGLKDAGVILTSKAQSIGGADYIIYRMLFQKQGLSYLFYVDTQTNTLKRVDLTGKTRGIEIAFQEKLTSLSIPASVPPETFTWTPPSGSKKSAKVTVDPF